MDFSKNHEYLDELKAQLLGSEKAGVELSRTWSKDFPRGAGVYAFYENGKLVYVGETKSIRDRMRDILDTRHHTLRRKIGEKNFSRLNGFVRATSKRVYPPDIERMVNDWLENKMEFSCMEVSLGRKELEERIIDEYAPIYNSPGRRGRQT